MGATLDELGSALTSSLRFWRGTMAHGSARQHRAGKVQVPYLVDPNTRTAMFESAAIRDYLLQTYAT